MNVREYFELTFHDYLECHQDESMREGLKSMPLDSNCGEDCKAVIDAAALLAFMVRKGYGDDRSHLIYPIAQAAAETCQVFIFG